MVRMSKPNSKHRKIEIVGLITSIPYQTAIKCATEIARYYPKIFSKPIIRGMLEFDWDEHLTKQRRKFGGQLWALLRPVAVYIDDEFIGSDEDLMEMVTSKFSCSMPNSNSVYKQAMIDDYTRYLVKSERLYVYLDINIDGKHIGHLIFQLYSDLLPATSYNFRCLCTGEERKELGYKGTQIHRIAKMGWIQGGDNEFITGGGGKSIYGAPFADESYCISHERRGVLSMANDGKHANGSQFFVTLQPALWMDYYYVAFGQLVEGVEVLKAIEAVEDRYEEPMKCIKIVDCGIVYEPTSKAYRKRMWPFKSEEIRIKSEEERERKKIDQEEKERKEKEESGSLLEDPHLADEVLDPRELDSNMYIHRYLAGLYYLFDVPPVIHKDEEQEGDGIVSTILEEAVDQVVDHIGRYILENLLKTVLSDGSDESDEEMIRRIVSEIVTKATIHMEVHAANEFVDYIINTAVDTVTRMYKEQSETEVGVQWRPGDTEDYDEDENEREDDDGAEDFQNETGEGDDVVVSKPQEVGEGSEKPVEDEEVVTEDKEEVEVRGRGAGIVEQTELDSPQMEAEENAVEVETPVEISEEAETTDAADENVNEE